MFWGNVNTKNAETDKTEETEETEKSQETIGSNEAFRAAYEANRVMDESGERLKSYMGEHQNNINNFIDVYSKYFYHVEILESLYLKCSKDGRKVCLAFCIALGPLIESCKNNEALTHTDALLLQTVIQTLGINTEEMKYKKQWGNKFIKKVGWD